MDKFFGQQSLLIKCATTKGVALISTFSQIIVLQSFAIKKNEKYTKIGFFKQFGSDRI